ncbi:MAG: leucine-rich repeat protein [Oscillospiraceae bacterium]
MRNRKILGFLASILMLSTGIMSNNTYAEGSLSQISLSGGSILDNIGQFTYDLIQDDGTFITLRYNLIDNEIYIKSYENSINNDTLNIPETIDGYPVVSISSNLLDFKNISIPKTVKILENGYKSRNITENITVDDENPYICAVDNVVYSKNMDTILFASVNVNTNLIVWDNVTTIGMEAFAYTDIYSISIPDNVINIETGAFAMCKNLTEIKLPKNLKEIPSIAFNCCENLTNIEIPNGVIIINASAFIKCNLKEIIIPESVKKIEIGAFNSCSNLTNVKFSDGLEYIGNSSFEGCNLSSVSIPKSVQTIEVGAFYNCKSLKDITVYGESTSLESYCIGYQKGQDGEATLIQDVSIHGYKGSTAEIYSNSNDIQFIEFSELLGDCNQDGLRNSSDILAIKRYLLHLDENIINADLNQDNKVNVIDIIKFKRILLHLESWQD